MKQKIFLYAAGLSSRILVMMCLAACAFTVSRAQEPADTVSRKAVVDSIAARYDSWQTATISGKLRMEGLPVTPSVKIFMERDSSVIISLRAPLMGEVGRAEIYSDTLLVVNKMKKTFVKEPLSAAFAYYPGTLSDVQSILLGRPVIAGMGELVPEIAGAVDLYPGSDGQYSLVPDDRHMPDGFNYGYLIDVTYRPVALLVLPLAKESTVVSVSYDYGEKGYDLSVVYESPDRNKGGTLELDYPVWEGSPIQPLKINGKYIQLNLSDFMKSF